jgi:hypothetical protein
LRTFSPIKFTGKFQVRWSIGSGGPLFIVVKVGACSWDMSASKSTRKDMFITTDENELQHV